MLLASNMQLMSEIYFVWFSEKQKQVVDITVIHNLMCLHEGCRDTIKCYIRPASAVNMCPVCPSCTFLSVYYYCFLATSLSASPCSFLPKASHFRSMGEPWSQNLIWLWDKAVRGNHKKTPHCFLNGDTGVKHCEGNCITALLHALFLVAMELIAGVRFITIIL